MQSFSYERAGSVADAIAAAQAPSTKFLAGGTNLLDLMKADIERPQRIVDISRLPLAQISELAEGGLRIGATVRMTDAANHPRVRQQYPLLSEALLAGASAQLRNMATVGGNLLQRTRCYYFYDRAFPACNKRDPGSGCGAREGFNRMHALFGASAACVATHPSDMAVALRALDAVVRLKGPLGERSLPLAQFYRLPELTPERDTNVRKEELIVAIDLPRSAFSSHFCYLKVRDRASFAFALVSVAVALEREDDRVADARIVLGGVAHKPWRCARSEEILLNQHLDADSVSAAAAAAVAGAQPLAHNAFKITLVEAALARALQIAWARPALAEPA